MLSKYKHTFSGDTDSKVVTINITSTLCGGDCQYTWSASGEGYSGESIVLHKPNRSEIEFFNQNIVNGVSVWNVWCDEEPDYRIEIELVKHGYEINGIIGEGGFGGEDEVLKNEINKYVDQFNNIADKIADEVNIRLGRELATANDLLQNAIADVNQAMKEIEGAKKEIEDAKKRLNTLDIDTLEKLNRTNEEIKKLYKDLEYAKEMIENAKGDGGTASMSIDELAGKIVETAAYINKTSGYVTDVKREINAQIGGFIDSAQTIDIVRSSETIYNHIVNTVNGTIETQLKDVTTGGVTTLKSFWDAISGEISTSIEKVNSDFVSNMDQIMNGDGWSVLSGKVVDLTTSATTSALSEVNARLGTIENRVESLNPSDGTITNLTSRIDGLNGTITNQGERIDTVSGTVSNVKSELDVANARITSNASYIDTVNSAVTSAVTYLDGKLGEMKTSIQNIQGGTKGEVTQFLSSEDGKSLLSGSVVDTVSSAVTAATQGFNARLGELEQGIFSASPTTSSITSLNQKFDLKTNSISTTVAAMSGDVTEQFSDIRQNLSAISLTVQNHETTAGIVAQITETPQGGKEGEVIIKADKIALAGNTIASAISATTISLGQNKSKFFSDGSGYLANSAITWTNTGDMVIGENVTIKKQLSVDNIRITSGQANTIIGGVNSGTCAFWGGGSNPNDASFAVDYEGNLKCKTGIFGGMATPYVKNVSLFSDTNKTYNYYTKIKPEELQNTIRSFIGDCFDIVGIPGESGLKSAAGKFDIQNLEGYGGFLTNDRADINFILNLDKSGLNVCLDMTPFKTNSDGSTDIVFTTDGTSRGTISSININSNILIDLPAYDFGYQGKGYTEDSFWARGLGRDDDGNTVKLEENKKLRGAYINYTNSFIGQKFILSLKNGAIGQKGDDSKIFLRGVIYSESDDDVEQKGSFNDIIDLGVTKFYTVGGLRPYKTNDHISDNGKKPILRASIAQPYYPNGHSVVFECVAEDIVPDGFDSGTISKVYWKAFKLTSEGYSISTYPDLTQQPKNTTKYN